MSSAKTAQPEEAENWVQVGHYPTLDLANDHGLVILAMGESCRVADAESTSGYDLQTETHPTTQLLRQLEVFSQEIAPTKINLPLSKEWPQRPSGALLTSCWIILLVTVFYLQRQDHSLTTQATSSSIELIAGGQWWRPFTALFLHADLPHLVGNVISGAIFGTLVSKSIGPMCGWALILGSGTLGNALVSWLTYPTTFISLGASVAVFAALGILSAFGVAETLRENTRLPWLRISAPFIAGLVLLGLMGGSNTNGNTDVLGHIFGFGSGLVTGTATAMIKQKRYTNRLDSRS